MCRKRRLEIVVIPPIKEENDDVVQVLRGLPSLRVAACIYYFHSLPLLIPRPSTPTGFHKWFDVELVRRRKPYIQEPKQPQQTKQKNTYRSKGHQSEPIY